MTLRKLLPAVIGVLIALGIGATIASITIARHEHHASRNLDPCPSPLTGKDASGTTQNFATQNDASNNCVGESAAYQAVQFTATLQSAAVANGNGTALSTTGLAGATMTVNCASCSGGTTVNFEAQEDGSDFVPIQGTKLDGSSQATTVTTAGFTVWQFNLSGVQQIRARISGYSAGTVTVTAHAIAVPAHYPTMGVLQTTSPWTVNQTQVGGSALALGQTTMASSVPVAIASNQAAVPASESGTWTVQPGNTANTTPWLIQDVPGTSGGTPVCYLAAAASTNATNCKNAAGQVYLYHLENTTSTLYYLRMYNLTTAPTCSSATGYVESIPIPASSTGAGVVVPQYTGEPFGTGVSFCVTGGSSSTDNTNAAVGVFVRILYK